MIPSHIRKANNRVRITAQLVDATTEGHLWAERYDRDLKDIFALQDEVAQKIVAALAVKLTEDEQMRLVRKCTDNMEAYDSVLKGKEYNNRYTEDANTHFLMGRYEEAIEALKRARDRNPNFLPAHVYLAASYSERGRQKEARAEAAEVEKLNPQTSMDAWKQRLPYKDQAVLERLFDSLRKAGLK